MNAFLAVWSQWIVVPVVTALGVASFYYSGLNYTGVRAGLKGDGIKITPEFWRAIRVMEREAKAVLNAPKGG